MDWRTSENTKLLCDIVAHDFNFVSYIKYKPIKFSKSMVIFCFWRSRRLVAIIKILCFSVIPLAAMASLAVHILIQYEQIQVIDEPIDVENVVKTIKANKRRDIAISHGSF